MKKEYKPPKKMPKVDPCPFCGSKDIRIGAFSVVIDYNISCEDCGAGFWDLKTVEECVKLWNTRINL